MILSEKLADGDLLERLWKRIYNSKDDRTKEEFEDLTGVSLNEFENHKDKNIEEIYLLLKNNSYKFSECKGIPKSKSSGGYRLTSVPIIKDRIVQKAIYHLVTPVFYPHINTGVSYCGVRKSHKKEKYGLNIKKAIKKLTTHVKNGNFWIFESDIKSFFDNILKDALLKKVTRVLNNDDSINRLIEQIIYFKIGNEEEVLDKLLELPDGIKGVAQGSSLSPLFSNLYLSDFFFT